MNPQLFDFMDIIISAVIGALVAIIIRVDGDKGLSVRVMVFVIVMIGVSQE